MKFPSWTPKWVIEEFEADFSDVVEETSVDWTEGDKQSKEWLQKVIQSPNSQDLWSALDKYADRSDRLAEFASFLWSAHWGFGHVSTKKSDRLRIAREARKKAIAFSKTFKKLTRQDWFMLHSIIASFANVSVDRRIADEVESFHKIYNDDPDSPLYVPIETLQRALPAISQIAKQFVAESIWGSLDYHVLGGLCGSIDKWAESEVIVTRPEHPNARRLYFIRSLTQSFCESYGKPMRKVTLALAEIFFNCDGLNEAAISRLAPVRSEAEMDDFTQPE